MFNICRRSGPPAKKVISFNEGIIANIDSSTIIQLRKALMKRDIVGSVNLPSLQKQARCFNKAFVRRTEDKPNPVFSDEPVVSERPTKTKYVLKEPKEMNFASWNLKFKGTTDVREFINRVEMLTTSRNVSRKAVARCFNEMLTEMALLWFLSLSRMGLSWAELKNTMITKFETPGTKVARKF